MSNICCKVAKMSVDTPEPFCIIDFWKIIKFSCIVYLIHNLFVKWIFAFSQVLWTWSILLYTVLPTCNVYFKEKNFTCNSLKLNMHHKGIKCQWHTAVVIKYSRYSRLSLIHLQGLSMNNDIFTFPIIFYNNFA